ncbi:hypothetical protein GCM10028895_32280 [Pontibacter rugosus]
MNKNSTLKISDVNSFVLIIVSLLVLASCSARVEREVDEQHNTTAVVAPIKAPSITVAAIENASDEVYFDLIAETSNCLGEDLWLGGKLESNDKVSLASSGAISPSKVYRITELTATGLNSNSSYLVNNKAHTLKAVTGSRGVVYIQLSQGQLQLVPQTDAKPLVLAYQPNPAEGYYDGLAGRWSCK